MAEEHLEQVELDAGEGEGAIAPLAFTGGEVEDEVAHTQETALPLESSAQQGPQAGQQFGQRERLDQVVVGPGIEALDPVVDGVAGRQHQDRRVVAGAAHAPAHGEAVDVGQPEIEDERVGRRLGKCLERFAARGYRDDVVPLEPERTVDGPPHGLIVVDHQDAHAENLPPHPGRRRAGRLSNL